MGGNRPEDAVLAQATTDFDCWSAGDPEGWGRSAAADITFFNNSPPLGRVDGVDAFRALLASWKGQIPPHRYELVDPKVQMFGSVSVLTLEYRALTPEGETMLRARGTTVYRKAEGGWEMVHIHFSNFDGA